MSLRTETYYICDICKAESTMPGFLSRLMIPVFLGDSDTVTVNGMEVCPKCKEKYISAVMDNFAEIHIDVSTREISEIKLKA